MSGRCTHHGDRILSTTLPWLQPIDIPASSVNGLAIVANLTLRTSVAVVGFWIRQPLRVPLAAIAD